MPSTGLALLAGEIAGLVLAGGASRRFGRDKATAILAGRALVAIALATLDQVAAEAAASASAASPAGRLAQAGGRTVIEDAPAHPRGPLAGIAAGLAWARDGGRGFLATLPCDAPLVTPEVLTRLAAAAQNEGGAYAITADGPQALIAVWRIDSLPALAKRLDAGEHPAVHQALAEAGAIPVTFENAAAFRNINVASDLAEVEASLAGAASAFQPRLSRW